MKSRFYVLSAFVLLLYLFANQTQIGWLYVAAALMGGVIGVSWWLNRRMLRGVDVRRTLSEPAAESYWEGDLVDITYEFTRQKPGMTLQLVVDAPNPAADPTSEAARARFFLPQLSPSTKNIDIKQEFCLYKRGLFLFDSPQAVSRAPFGLFSKKGTLPVSNGPARLLVYPELRPLARLSLLDRQPAAQLPRSRVGTGQEVLSVRPFRTGDSLRHIHWRSVARTGRLISKEFADERLPGLTILLDHRPLCAPIHTLSKFTPFETAVKIAASLGEYALRHRYPLYLAIHNGPRGALTAEQFWPVLSRLEIEASHTLNEISVGIQTEAVAVVLSAVDKSAINLLDTLRQRGYTLQVILLDGPTFPDHEETVSPVLAVTFCQRWEIPVTLIAYDDDWSTVLEGA
ncbi:MAG: DUF58 domain-containing protein [Ardenticatenaceae bacterium]|nr:DUF58 domain-containing protein [Ardenticatenaceae bacterium]